LLVSEIMKNNVITAFPHETIREATVRMVQNRIRHLPIVNQEHQLIGIVSDRDLREACPSRLSMNQEEFAVLDAPVSKIMKSDVITCHPMDFVEEAAYTLYQYRIGCLPVIQNQKLVGILTETDILHTLVELMGVHQPSSHIEVEVEDQSGVLADVANVFKACHINVSSVLVYPGKNANTKRLVFRVRTMDPRKALEQLNEKGYQIIWPEQVEGNHE
jgi:acetoin utilization protein AcuB